MKKKLFSLIAPAIMKLTIIQILIFSLFFNTYAHEDKGQDILDTKVSIVLKNAEVKKVLQELQKVSGIYFVYSPEVIRSARKVDVKAKLEKLGKILNDFLQPLNITYEVVNNYIVLNKSGTVLQENVMSKTAVKLLVADDVNTMYNDKVITGTVTDEEGVPLSNVSITIKGTENGTMTDNKGFFRLSVVNDKNAVLVISFIGYTKQEIMINDKANYTVKLISTDTKLNEVVVVGYGTAKKKNVVGALDVISAKSAGSNAATSAEQLLIGKSAGVQVVNSSGVPGAGAQIIIRGTGSFSDVSPLYVIDGIQGDFNSISPQDIDNITILKDASQTAIYGASGANGVVIVTTKRAKSGTPKISFTSKLGMAQVRRKLDLLKTKDYIDIIKDIAATNNQPVPVKFTNGTPLTDVTDWQNEVFRKGMITENYLNVTGGSEKVLYNMSVGYITQQAIVKDFENRRLNLRIGLEENLGRFRFGQVINIRSTKNKGQLASISDMVLYAPYQPIFDPAILSGYSILSNRDDNANTSNPLQALGVRTQSSDEYVFAPQLFGEVSLIKGLKFRSQMALTIGGGSNRSFQIPYTQSNFLTFDRQAGSGLNKYNTYTFENYFTYNTTIGRHEISATAGNSYIDAGSSEGINIIGTNLPNNNIPYPSVALTQAVSSSFNGYATGFGNLISYFGRVGYTYNNKYILSASFRRDGSSNFGINNRFGNFPAAGLAYKFSEESFIKNNFSFITDGKVRVGWGRTGNNRIPLFLTDVNTYSGSPSGNLVYSFGSNEAFNSGTTINTLSNPNLKWELTNQTNVGLDLELFSRRVTLTLDLYKRTSSGLLVRVPIPTSNGVGGVSGVTSSIVTNAADAENTGIEFAVGYNSIPKKDFNYSLSVNGAFNKNRVLSLGSQFQAPIRDGAFNQINPFTYTAKGSPIGSFYGYTVGSVAKDKAEIDALNAKAPGGKYQDGLLPGDFIFKDINGDNQLTDADQQVLGNAMPKFLYGINSSVRYKNFDINLVISGVTGLKIANTTRFYTHNASTGGNSTTAFLDRWKKPGDVTSLPRAGQSITAGGNLRPSDFFLENGSFLRLRNFTIGFTIPGQSINRLTKNVFTSFRLYVAAENLITITKYKGFDPEVSSLNSDRGEGFIFRRGMDNFQLPQPRIFMAGIQIGL